MMSMRALKPSGVAVVEPLVEVFSMKYAMVEGWNSNSIIWSEGVIQLRARCPCGVRKVEGKGGMNCVFSKKAENVSTEVC